MKAHQLRVIHGLGLACCLAWFGQFSGAAPSPVARAHAADVNLVVRANAAMDASRYREARELLLQAKGRDQGPALLGLARLALVEGNFKEAERLANRSKMLPGVRPWDAGETLAMVLSAQGQVAQAIDQLRPFEQVVEARRARLWLGELLLRAGKDAEARGPLMSLIEDYNADRITEQDAEGLALVGRAAHLLRKRADANDAYNQSEKTGVVRIETLLWRAELFLDAYDTGHAEQVLREFSKIAPKDPDGLVMTARMKLQQAYDFAAAESLARQALATNPNHTGALGILASVALFDFDLPLTEKHLQRGLSVNPRDLELLSIQASARFLADDSQGFQVAKNKVFAENVSYSRFYQIVESFAEVEHRYDDIVRMMRDAVQVSPSDGRAWAVLGTNLIRQGNETEGVEALRTSWRFDKFNVRAYNTLNLFERDIPALYDSVELGSFRFRFEKKHRVLLERYVPSVLERAYQSMVVRYKHTPTTRLGLELYATDEHFSVRTSGVPHVGIQGVCFGNTLASMSPVKVGFNWANVLWHELAHVFAIQLSHSHVPRWFTEGLSELETFLENPTWQREEDMALFVALRENRLPHVANLNRAFSHAKTPGDMMTAYYASSQLVLYLHHHYGMDKLVTMLRLWGKGLRDSQVVQEALGASVEAVNEQFRVWLGRRLERYRHQFVADDYVGPLDVVEAAAKSNPKDPRKQAAWLAALVETDREGALAKLESLVREFPKDPDVSFLRASWLMDRKKYQDAHQVLLSMLANGQDGYVVQMSLADCAEQAKDWDAMRRHLEGARRHDPTQIEPLQALHDLARKQKNRVLATATLMELYVLDQHNPRVVSRLLHELVKEKRWADALKVGKQAIHLDLGDVSVHWDYAQALRASSRQQDAKFEAESALLCEPQPGLRSEIEAFIAQSAK